MLWGGPTQTFYEDEPSPRTKEDYIKLANETFLYLDSLYHEGGWDLVSESEKVKMWNKPLQGYDIPMIRMEGLMSASPKEVFNMHEDAPLETKKKWDRLLNHMDIVEKVTDDIEVMSAQFNGIFPVGARDICALKVIKPLKDGTICGYGRTINHPDRPITSSFVRAKGKMISYCHPVPGNPYQCRFVRLVLMNPMGSIPNWIIKLVQSEAPKFYYVLDDILLERYGERKAPQQAPSLEAAPPKGKEKAPADDKLDLEEEESTEEEEVDEEGDLFHDVAEFDGGISARQLMSMRDQIQSLVKTIERSSSELDSRLNRIENSKQAPVSVLASQNPLENFFGVPFRLIALFVGWPVVVAAFYHFLLRRR